MSIKGIIFDFDGVIAESVEVKTRAFYKLYRPFGDDIARKVVDHHKVNGGISRNEKFKIYHEKFLGKTLGNQELQQLSRQFGELVVGETIDSAEVDGVLDFLTSYHGIIRFWIVSATPIEEIRRIVKEKKLSGFFQGVYGSPSKKGYWVAHILDKWRMDSGEVVLIGDAIQDYEAARGNGIRFVLRETEDNRDLFSQIEVPKVRDFSRFDEILEDLN